MATLWILVLTVFLLLDCEAKPNTTGIQLSVTRVTSYNPTVALPTPSATNGNPTTAVSIKTDSPTTTPSVRNGNPTTTVSKKTDSPTTTPSVRNANPTTIVSMTIDSQTTTATITTDRPTTVTQLTTKLAQITTGNPTTVEYVSTNTPTTTSAETTVISVSSITSNVSGLTLAGPLTTNHLLSEIKDLKDQTVAYMIVVSFLAAGLCFAIASAAALYYRLRRLKATNWGSRMSDYELMRPKRMKFGNKIPLDMRYKDASLSLVSLGMSYNTGRNLVTFSPQSDDSLVEKVQNRSHLT